MARLIDANALIDWLTKPTGFIRNCDDCPDIDCVHCVIEDAIKTAPTVDAVEVVRCKDCKHCITDQNIIGGYGDCLRFDPVNKNSIVQADDFCSYGERRSDV